jgi:hypothetical protein
MRRLQQDYFSEVKEQQLHITLTQKNCQVGTFSEKAEPPGTRHRQFSARDAGTPSESCRRREIGEVSTEYLLVDLEEIGDKSQISYPDDVS